MGNTTTETTTKNTESKTAKDGLPIFLPGTEPKGSLTVKDIAETFGQDHVHANGWVQCNLAAGFITKVGYRDNEGTRGRSSAFYKVKASLLPKKA